MGAHLGVNLNVNLGVVGLKFGCGGVKVLAQGLYNLGAHFDAILGALKAEFGCKLGGVLKVGVRFLLQGSMCVVIGSSIVPARCIDTM